MRKKYLSALLFGALLFASAGTFTSCKDYDDDINNLQTQITANADAIKKLQDMVGDGKWVTSVVGIENGIKVTMNDGSSTDILGIDGEDGTVVTIIDGYWAFDGVKSEYPATPGSAGEAHEIKISEDGYWMIWDTEKGEYVTTTYAVAPISAAKNPADGSWTITIKNADGTTSSITIASAALTHIEVIKGTHICGANDMSYNYGIVRTDVKWGWNEDKVMGAGMYSKLGTDMLLLLNPAGVEGDTYKYTLKNSAGTEAPVTFFDTAEPYTGKPLARATSANALWTLPAHITKTEANDIEKRRRDLYLNFKINDSEYYDLAVEATSPEGGKVFSDYVNKVNLKEVGGDEELDNLNSVECLVGQAYEPTFEGDAAGLIYDYELRLNQSAENLKKAAVYEADVTDDGHAWIAKKEAGVYNGISFDIIYILLDGTVQKIENYVTVNFTTQLTEEKDPWYLKEATAYVAVPLDAKESGIVKIGDTEYKKFIFTETFDLSEKVAAMSDMDQKIWNQAVEQYRAGNSGAFTAVLTGGDGENNTADNNKEVAKRIQFSIDDKNKITFTYNVSEAWNNNKNNGVGDNFLLDKAYKYTITVVDPDNKGNVLTTIVLPFEFTQPTLDITRENDKFTQWSSDYKTLTAYGAYGHKERKNDTQNQFNTYKNDKMYVPMYEAFKAWTTEYTEYDENAPYYTLTNNDKDNVLLLGKGKGVPAYLEDDLKYLAADWAEWNTSIEDAKPGDENAEKQVKVTANFKHYGVYPEEKVTDFTLVFGSFLKNSTMKMADGKETLVVNTGTHDVFISNDDLNLLTPKDGKFFLFDGIKADGTVVYRKTLNEASFNEEQRGFMTVNEIFNVKNFSAKDKNGSYDDYKFEIKQQGYEYDIDYQTGKRTLKITENPAEKETIKIYQIPAISAEKATDDEVADPATTWLGAHTGGMVIQLPKSVADQEEVEITLTVKDDLGFTNDLKFTVKKIQ